MLSLNLIYSVLLVTAVYCPVFVDLHRVTEKVQVKVVSMDGDRQEDVEMTEESNTVVEEKTYLPGDPLGEDDELVCDESAYIMLYGASTGYPCLSFDIIQDALGEARETYPLTAYLVAGTQASRTHTNNLLVMKIWNMHKTHKVDGESESDSEDSDDSAAEERNPKMHCDFINHQGCVNRIRSTVLNNTVLAASWSELGQVSIWNLNPHLEKVDSSLPKKCKENAERDSVKPLFTFSGHQMEGYGLDWCSTSRGVLASGDCKHGIHIWNPAEGGIWHVDQRPLKGHTNSVEDLQWSPNERHVLASCSVDKSIRIWDTRCAPNRACKITVENAHESDVNVISWNRSEALIVSGGDDGVLHVWDLRVFKTGSAVASFKHHMEPVTTVEWHPTDATVFASGGADNQIALWDLSLERDLEACPDDVEKIAPQLLFIHQGQTDVKELHWHPQLTGVIISTALSGLNVFRTISV